MDRGEARNPVDPRFISLFNAFEIQFRARQPAHHLQQHLELARRQVEPRDSGRGGGSHGCHPGLYNYILEKLPATPSRFHYIFNLRDLSRIYEGILCHGGQVQDPGRFHPSLRNEALRILHDRLISKEDKTVVIEKMNELCWRSTSSQEQILRDLILFGDYLNASEELGLDENGNEKPKTLRLYEDVKSYVDVKPVFDSILELCQLNRRR